MYCICWYDLDPIQGQGQGHGAFELLKTAHNCTLLLGLSPAPLLHAAQNWCLIMIVWDLIYSFSKPDFRIPSRKAITRVQTSRNVDISRNSNGHIGSAWGYSQMVVRAGSTTAIVHVDMTLTRSKVKVKVTARLNFRNCRKFYNSRSISSAISARSWKVMVDHDSTGPSLQLGGAWFSHFLLRNLSRVFKLLEMSTLH